MPSPKAIEKIGHLEFADGGASVVQQLGLLPGEHLVGAQARPLSSAKARLGGPEFDAEGQDALAAYLRELDSDRLGVSARKGSAPRRLLLQARRRRG